MKAEKDKLEILQSLDHFRTWRYWKSLDDQRVCILCEKKFKGHEVQITRFDNGKDELQCPTKDCNSGPHQWVYPDARLIPDTTEPGWWGYSPKAGTQIRDRVSSSRLSGPAESDSWDYSPKAGKPPRSMVTIAKRSAIDLASAGANLIPARRERHSNHSEQPPRNPCREAYDLPQSRMLFPAW